MQITPKQADNVVVRSENRGIQELRRLSHWRYEAGKTKTVWEFQIGLRLKHTYTNMIIQGEKREYEVLSLVHPVLLNLSHFAKNSTNS